MYRLLTDWCCMCSPALADASVLSFPALLFQPTSTLQYNKLWMSADYFEDTWWFWLRSVWSHQEDLSSLGIIKDKKYAPFNSFSFFVLVRYLLRSKQQKAKQQGTTKTGDITSNTDDDHPFFYLPSTAHRKTNLSERNRLYPSCSNSLFKTRVSGKQNGNINVAK